MQNVKVKSKLILFATIIFLIGCKQNKKTQIQKQENVKPLTFNLELNKFGRYAINTEPIDWNKHETDSIIYFYLTFQNIKKEPIVLKTSLVSTGISFMVEFKKLKRLEKSTTDKKIEYYSLNLLQHFNTIYIDSIIFKASNNIDILAVDQAFRIGYHHIGIEEICQLKVIQQYDTIDLSTYKMENCIERKY